MASLHTARVEGKFIDNQLAGADKQGGVAARRDWNCNVTAEPVGNNFCGVRTAQSAALQPGVSTGRSLNGTSGGQCGQLKHEYKAGDVDHEDVHDD